MMFLRGHPCAKDEIEAFHRECVSHHAAAMEFLEEDKMQKYKRFSVVKADDYPVFNEKDWVAPKEEEDEKDDEHWIEPKVMLWSADDAIESDVEISDADTEPPPTNDKKVDYGKRDKLHAAKCLSFAKSILGLYSISLNPSVKQVLHFTYTGQDTQVSNALHDLGCSWMAVHSYSSQLWLARVLVMPDSTIKLVLPPFHRPLMHILESLHHLCAESYRANPAMCSDIQ
eukprot:10035934-Karenia_brevis.AAC.1